MSGNWWRRLFFRGGTSEDALSPKYLDFCVLENQLEHPCAKPISLPLDLLKYITCDFSQRLELGRGGFGVVYKGILPNGKVIAVKRFHDIHLKDDQFHNEVTYLIERRHENIVRLMGYCEESRSEATKISDRYVMVEKRQRLICFEYLSNNSLYNYLSDESSGLELPWHIRYEIIKGICCGLHYLHKECNIVHLDLKPQNILMADNMVPKIADFGMSRLFGQQQSLIITQNCGGTFGYMAPEYINNGLISTKSDIFSLGVIIIELLTGCRDYPRSRNDASIRYFMENVVEKWRNKFEKKSKDIPLEMYCQQVNVCTVIGMMCVDPDPKERPAAWDIIQTLNGVNGEQLVDKVNINTSGSINYRKLVYMSNKLEREKKLITMFSYFDKDGDDFITIAELSKACREFGLDGAHLENLINKNIDELCPLCREVPDSAYHLLVHCRYTMEVWASMAEWTLQPRLHPSAWEPSVSVSAWWSALLTSATDNIPRKATQTLIVLVVWKIWKERNARVFNQKKLSVASLVNIIKEEARSCAAAGTQHFAPDHNSIYASALSRLKKVSTMNMLKKMAFRFIAENLSEKEIKGLEDVFIKIDTKNSGTITFDQLKDGLKAVRSGITENEIQTSMELAGIIDNCGAINYGELLRMTKPEREGVTMNELSQACLKFGLDYVHLKDVTEDVDQLCPLCRQVPESVHHLLADCRYTKRVWASMAEWTSQPRLHPSTWKPSISVPVWWSALTSATDVQRKATRSFVLLVSSEIWKERDARVFNRKELSAPALIHKAKKVARTWAAADAHLALFLAYKADGSEYTQYGFRRRP